MITMEDNIDKKINVQHRGEERQNRQQGDQRQKYQQKNISNNTTENNDNYETNIGIEECNINIVNLEKKECNVNNDNFSKAEFSTTGQLQPQQRNSEATIDNNSETNNQKQQCRLRDNQSRMATPAADRRPISNNSSETTS